MDDAPPPFRWLFGTAEQKRQARQYWIHDTAIGLYYLAAHFILRLLPIDWCSAFGAFTGRFSPARFPASARRARDAWIRLCPDAADQASVDAAMGRLWRSIGRTVAEYSVADRLWAQGRIVVEGKEYFDRAKATGRPLLVLALHLGNWEVTPLSVIAMGVNGLNFSFYLVPANRFEHRIVVRARRRYECFPVAATSANTKIALQNLKGPAKFFLMYVDEYARGRVFAPAFGRVLRPEGNIAYAARLAAMTDAIILPTYAVRIGDSARFKLTFLPPIDRIESGDKDADLMTNIANINAVIEPVIKAHLDQWYYLLDFRFDD